jgi:lysophospholipase L1-like esterase
LLNELNIKYKKVAWVGDSITEQGKPGIGNGVGFTTFIEDIYSNITYINEGIGGNTTKDLINRLSTIKAHNPDLFFLSIGINDARYNDNRGAVSNSEYKSNVKYIINSLKEDGKIVVLNSVFPAFWQDANSNLLIEDLYERFKEWNKILKDISIEQEIIYIDSFTNITHFINYTNVESYIPDGVHPDLTGTKGKRLYAESVLYDEKAKDFFDSEGDHFFRLEVLNNNQGGYCGIKHISLRGHSSIHDMFAFSQNGTANKVEDILGAYNSSYAGFTNKKDQFPLNILFSTQDYPTSISTTGKPNYLNVNRGITNYRIYYSNNPMALENFKHRSWRLLNTNIITTGVAVNLIPQNRNNVFYQIRFDTNNIDPEIVVSKIKSEVPINIWTQNEKSNSSRRYDELFINGISNSADYIIGLTAGFNITWEAEDDLTEIVLESPNSSIRGWKLYKSTDKNSFGNPSHTSWIEIENGSGNQTINL